MNYGLLMVSVVVVVTGLRIVVSSDVVVLVDDFLSSEAQADSNAKATAARDGRIRFFMGMFF